MGVRRTKASPDLRPLTSRILTSITDTLRPYCSEAQVLDLYSGQGRFAQGVLLEGASQVICVEKDRSTAARLSCDSEKIVLVVGDALGYLEQAKQKGLTFDIVFADPPFRLWTDSYAIELLEAVSPLLREGSIFLVRYPKRVLASLPILSQGHLNLVPWKFREMGESGLSYFQSRSDEP